MIPLLAQPISNEESTNILPVPWIRFHRCRFHGIGRLVSCPGRGAARSAAPQSRDPRFRSPSTMGPGSAAHRFTLRRARGTGSFMDRDFLIDLFAEFGPVTIRRMFSGFGISADGTNFALALRAGLYFRADEQSIPQFEAEGSRPFQYQTRAKTVTVNSYWQLPARLFDDSEELADWARAALAPAPRAAVRKRPN